MSDRDICPPPAIITAGATRRAALGTLLGGALLLGARDGSEANTEAKRRKQRQKKNLSWQSRMVQVTIDNVNSLVPAYVVYGMYDNSRDWNGCCRQLGTISVPPASVWTFQAPRAEFGVGNNAWVWIDNTYWFRFHNPEAGSPGVGIALNGMLDHDSNPYCCPTLPWGQTVEYQRGMGPRSYRTYNIANKALFRVDRLSDVKDYKRFMVTMPFRTSAEGETPAETP